MKYASFVWVSRGRSNGKPEISWIYGRNGCVLSSVEQMCVGVEILCWVLGWVLSSWSGANSTPPLPPLLSLLRLLQTLSSPFQSRGRTRWASSIAIPQWAIQLQERRSTAAPATVGTLVPEVAPSLVRGADCPVFCICLLTTNKYQKYKLLSWVELGDKLFFSDRAPGMEFLGKRWENELIKPKFYWIMKK